VPSPRLGFIVDYTAIDFTAQRIKCVDFLKELDSRMILNSGKRDLKILQWNVLDVLIRDNKAADGIVTVLDS
jgi:hypothetical protein